MRRTELAFLRTTGTIAAGLAFAVLPAFALAHDDNSDNNLKIPAIDKTTVSISISGNGSTLVRGAKVTDISDDVITAVTAVNGTSLTWRIDTDADTDFVEADSSGSSLGAISDGDYVSFSGMLDGAFEVNADTVRDWSIGEAKDGPRWPWYRLDKWPVMNFFMHAKADKDR
ncbi:MAG: hypothetical protein WDN10_02870 [bacterium]